MLPEPSRNGNLSYLCIRRAFTHGKILRQPSDLNKIRRSDDKSLKKQNYGLAVRHYSSAAIVSGWGSSMVNVVCPWALVTLILP